MSRQAYYQGSTRTRMKREVSSGVLSAIREVRRHHPRMGVRKLLFKIRSRLSGEGLTIGRDRLFDLMRSEGLLVKRRRRGVRTTDSRHRFRTYVNLIKDIVPEHAHEVLVSDLTYIRIHQGFVYLALVTDAYSRKIVGYEVNDTLESVGCIRALKKALAQVPWDKRPIHHSDRGTQYCCHEYIQCLRERRLSISMTEENHCYENALAERVNGILKDEYLLNRTFATKGLARQACRQAIELYNMGRPHLSLNMQTPEQVHAA